MSFIRYKNYCLFFLLLASLMLVASACKQKPVSDTHEATAGKPMYTCSMHPEIIRDKPGDCPICGMTLVKKETDSKEIKSIAIEDLLKPTNEFVISALPVTTIQNKTETINIEALGSIQNDTREIGTISAIVSGRIEKLYVRYRYQMIERGEKIMDIYSPEIATAQQNLVFLLKSDAANISLVEAAKQRLLLMGMSNNQLNQLVKTAKPSLTISVYANAMGHIHEAGEEAMKAINMDASLVTAPLAIREGMYVQSGERIFLLTNPAKAWAVLNIFPENQQLIKVGDAVKLTTGSIHNESFQAKISFIEPFYRQGNRTLTARVYFDNSNLQIPIGSQVRANIFGSMINSNWLPKTAVLSLGIDNVVFIKNSNGFSAHKIQTGIKQDSLIQVVGGLSDTDTVASNAQYLTDSESFITIKQ